MRDLQGKLRIEVKARIPKTRAGDVEHLGGIGGTIILNDNAWTGTVSRSARWRVRVTFTSTTDMPASPSART